MLDFVKISTRSPKRGIVEVYPKFIVRRSKDLMIRGGKFYAVWDEAAGLWSTDEFRAQELIDNEIEEYYNKYKSTTEDNVIPLYIWDDNSGSAESWIRYTTRHCIDNYHQLDTKLTFLNDKVNKQDYASRRLSYPLAEGDHSAYDEMLNVLYSPWERKKLEWAIGAIISGDSRNIQKFEVIYGSAGTGKSTVLNIVQMLFDGYYTTFDSKALGSASASFALEPFASNPLVAIQHDGDLSKIEDNTRLNQIVSHEEMTVNEKFTKQYTNRFNCFLFLGTNKPVRITDAKSGIIRRLIDVSPTGNKLPFKRYMELNSRVKFELGAIAHHCLQVYLSDPNCYDNYIPVSMLGATNDFYNFVLDSFDIFSSQDGVTLKQAWEMYKTYCSDANVPYPYSMRLFKEELKNYYSDFKERERTEEGVYVRNYYTGFKTDKFEVQDEEGIVEAKHDKFEFKSIPSLLDMMCQNCKAQYANKDEKPTKKWDDVVTTLRDLDTSKVHYVKIPENYIVIDFDLKNKEGEKSYRKNLEAIQKWPLTYAELSKSGNGIHLHYIYDGDVTQLSRIYDEDIEIKVFTGGSSLRRKLTKCNDIPIATINSGLPLKGEKKMVSSEVIKDEKHLINKINKALRKEVFNYTKPNVDYISMVLEQAYNSGMHYDVTSMRPQILSFAAGSTHQSSTCISMVNKMKFHSEDVEEPREVEFGEDAPIIFYDVEVFPNLFILCWKYAGEKNSVVKMINPGPEAIEKLIKNRLIGFNCRRYDNHIIYARLMGYTNKQLYALSQRIISGEKDAFFGNAYNLSYTDIYDFASAGNKKSLKKLEIEMGMHHQECRFKWDEPVPEENWEEVADYCVNDVLATEAVFNHLSPDWVARQILADLAGMTVNDTTNTLTTRIIFGDDKKPQSQFQYRNLAEPVEYLEPNVLEFLKEACPEMMSVKHGSAKSLLPYFDGYSFDKGVSTYRGEVIGEGGYVYAEQGIWVNVALLDIMSMHPHSGISECFLGVRHTKAFRDLVRARVAIKHQDWAAVETLLDGKLIPYISKVKSGEITSKLLADALKTAINSVYGLTAAKFDNSFRDPRNVDNIIAKRGALFMVDLKHEVQKRGYTVAHIKTDSIKIPNATPEIIEFVMNFGKKYGYTFEHEETYDRMCLVNDAVYIAKYKKPHIDKDTGKEIWWTATGTQFAVPFVFKTLFSKDPISIDDMCETKTVTTALYLDYNEGMPDDYHDYRFVGKTGLFCPIKKGCGGALLLREAKDKFTSVVGTKGYRWMESEDVIKLGKENDIDRGYYISLVNDAVDAISKYGDFEWFVSDSPTPEIKPDFMNIPEDVPDEVPFDDYITIKKGE